MQNSNSIVKCIIELGVLISQLVLGRQGCCECRILRNALRAPRCVHYYTDYIVALMYYFTGYTIALMYYFTEYIIAMMYYYIEDIIVPMYNYIIVGVVAWKWFVHAR